MSRKSRICNSFLIFFTLAEFALDISQSIVKNFQIGFQKANSRKEVINMKPKEEYEIGEPDL